jgi:hypothetical protein
MLSTAGGGRVSEWFRDPPRRHPWKPVPYPALATAGRVPDGCRYGAVIGAAEGLRRGCETPSKTYRRKAVGTLPAR